MSTSSIAPHTPETLKAQVVQTAIETYQRILRTMHAKINGTIQDLQKGIFLPKPYGDALSQLNIAEFEKLQTQGVFYHGTASKKHWEREGDADSLTYLKPFVFKIARGVTASEALDSLESHLTILSQNELPLVCYLIALRVFCPTFDDIFREHGGTPLRIAAQPDDLGSLFRLLEFKPVPPDQVEVGGKICKINHPDYPVKFLGCDYEVNTIGLKIAPSLYATPYNPEGASSETLDEALLTAYNGKLSSWDILAPITLQRRRLRGSFHLARKEQEKIKDQTLSLEQFRAEKGGEFGAITYHLNPDRLFQLCESPNYFACNLMRTWQKEPLDEWVASFNLPKAPGSNSPPLPRKNRGMTKGSV